MLSFMFNIIQGFDFVYYIRLKNENGPERMTEFVRGYSKLNECWK